MGVVYKNYDQKYSSTEIRACLAQFVNCGVSAEEASVGLEAYARSWPSIAEQDSDIPKSNPNVSWLGRLRAKRKMKQDRLSYDPTR
jgi:hypothetical protein